MRRITLGGEECVELANGPNLKLAIPPRGLAQPEWPMQGADGKAIWPPPDRRPAMRTYSVRRHNPDAREIDVDFFLHGTGPASTWAQEAVPGDVIGIGVPGGRAVAPGDWYLLTGDEAALPGISRILEELPASARGHAFIEVNGDEDELPVVTRSGVHVTWLHRGSAPAGTTTLLADAVRRLDWPRDQQVSAWISGESDSVRAIRSFVRDERLLPAAQIVAIGYWRRGLSETEYKARFNNDREPAPAGPGPLAGSPASS